MNGTRIFTVLNGYPVFPIAFSIPNLLALIPVASVIYVAQIAPLHNNCRYILCVWTTSYATVFLLNISIGILDSTTGSGYMPGNMFEPHLRFVFYQAHVSCTAFCSICEIALSIERRIAIIKPRAYHFTEARWEILIPTTLVLMLLAYLVDQCVHSVNARLVFIGCVLLNVIEISVLVTSALTTKACRVKYEQMYGKASLTARYQVNEAYEMSRAMMPGYFLSFLLKRARKIKRLLLIMNLVIIIINVLTVVQASTIIFLCVFLAVKERHPYLLGYLEAYYFLIDACNGSFSMVFLLSKHPQLRKHAVRKLRIVMGLRPEAKVGAATNKQNAEIHFNQLAVYWK